MGELRWTRICQSIYHRHFFDERLIMSRWQRLRSWILANPLCGTIVLWVVVFVVFLLFQLLIEGEQFFIKFWRIVIIGAVTNTIGMTWGYFRIKKLAENGD